MKIESNALAEHVSPSHYEKPGLIEKLRLFLNRNDNVLDAGCGRGIDAARLHSECGVRVVGFDTDLRALVEAKERGIDVVRADLDQGWPIRSGAIDAVLAVFVIHNVKDKRRFLSESARSLRAGGRLYILTASHEDIQRRWLNQFFPSLSKIDCERYPCTGAISEMISDHGMHIQSISGVVIGTEHLNASYLNLVQGRNWSSLRLLPDTEFAEGARRFSAFFVKHADGGQAINWPNSKTLVVAKKL